MAERKVIQLDTDVLVVGSEGAGARAAISADSLGARSILSTKGVFGGSGVTLMAPFSCCVAFGHEDPRDNPFEHFKDTVIGGQFLGNQKVIEVFTENAPRRLLELESFGAKFEKREDGKFKQVIMPGHSYPRAIFYDFQTGIQFKKGLMREVSRRPNITVKEDLFVIDVFLDAGKVAGALALDIRTGDFVQVNAKAVVLATGGAMELYYPHSDASCDMTGDGMAIALRAGGRLVDMEFAQFFPTGMVWPPALIGVIWIGQLRYKCGGLLYNRYGERFMKKWDPERMELSTRDITSRAIVTEILEGRGTPHGGVWLDVSYLGNNIVEAFVEEVFPGFSFRGYNLLDAGVDIRKDAIEVAPVAHFFMGGVEIDERCETGIPGLLAGGEVTAGVNGANRIEGNALAETQVFGALAGERAAEYANKAPNVCPSRDDVESRIRAVEALLERNEGLTQLEVRRKIQDIMWKAVGVVRRGDHLEKAVSDLERIRVDMVPRICVKNKQRTYNREWFEALETMNMALVAESMARSALSRKESRGAHYRTDYTKRDNENWLKNSVISLDRDGNLVLSYKPVTITKLPPMEVSVDVGE